MFSIEALEQGAMSGLVEFNKHDKSGLSPSLVVNDKAKGEKVLVHILRNLEYCSSFRFAVAFITPSGVACIHQALKEAVERGCTGEILVSTYLNFSDPIAIDRLRRFPGVTVRFIEADDFHGKLYFFSFSNSSYLLVGSSNLTQAALGKNSEINLGFQISNKSGLYLSVSEQFDAWLQESPPISDAMLARYEEIWNKQRPIQPWISRSPNQAEFQNIDESPPVVIPNAMQIEALERLAQVRSNGDKRTLIVSATGTGKTVLSALDVKQFGAKRMLFVVHRLNIAKRALGEFQMVFGKSKKMGIYSGADRSGLDADFIFATIQTINTETHLDRFDKSAFDYIIIDESHHAGAKTYQRILNHFAPGFLLGMTATPERTDGFNIYELFNHSIAYEIRLHQALDADLLAPFHYFGIADLTVNSVVIDDKSKFNQLVSKERVSHIIKALNEYGCCDWQPKGLVFCSKVEEAQELAKMFTAAGKPSIALSGSNSENERESAILRLEAQASNERLSYIFTVDIFNEGIDIPSVNQIIMLRPTESAIIFVQQLGRGLRKEKSKEYLTVLDFIGNYENNFLVPVALFGDASFNRDNLRRLMEVGSGMMPGESSISFDRISREQIFKSISNARVDSAKYLAQDYELLKFRLGHHPMMIDFFNLKQRDPYQYVDKAGSLLAYRLKKEVSETPPAYLLSLLEYFSKYVFDGVRAEESLILLALLDGANQIDFDQLKGEVSTQFGLVIDDETIDSAIHSLNLKFVTEITGGKGLPIGEIHGYDVVNKDLKVIYPGATLTACMNEPLLREYLRDLVCCSLENFKNDFSSLKFNCGFLRGKKYSRRDVFRLLQWKQNPNAQNVGGYVVSSDKRQCPIFVNYHKDDSISATTKYEDHFVNTSTLVYMSKSRRSLQSPDVEAIRNQATNGLRIPIFVKKSNDEGLSFYYLGEGKSESSQFVESTMPVEQGKSVSVVKMVFTLDMPVEEGLYRYLTRVPI